MRRNLIRLTNLRLRIFCRRLTLRQRKFLLGVLLFSLVAANVYTLYQSFTDWNARKSAVGSIKQSSLRMEFIQSIVRNGERKNRENYGTADKTVQGPILRTEEAH